MYLHPVHVHVSTWTECNSHFHTALLKVDQTNVSWTTSAVTTAANQEGKKGRGRKETRLIYENGSPFHSAGSFRTKTNNGVTPNLCSLWVSVFTLVFKSKCFFTRSCPVWAASEAMKKWEKGWPWVLVTRQRDTRLRAAACCYLYAKLSRHMSIFCSCLLPIGNSVKNM